MNDVRSPVLHEATTRLTLSYYRPRAIMINFLHFIESYENAQ
jgi:hypothetical protein